MVKFYPEKDELLSKIQQMESKLVSIDSNKDPNEYFDTIKSLGKTEEMSEILREKLSKGPDKSRAVKLLGVLNKIKRRKGNLAKIIEN